MIQPTVEPVFNFVRVVSPDAGINGLYDPAEARRWVKGIQDNLVSKEPAHRDWTRRFCDDMIDAAETAEAYLANHGNIEDDIVKVCEEYQAANPGA